MKSLMKLFVMVVAAFLVSVALVPFSVTTAVAQEKAEGAVVEEQVSQEKKLQKKYEIGTMTVTAQKQEENVQEVPVSITEKGDGKGGRWFQNNLTHEHTRDRLSSCPDNQDLIRPGPCIMLWARASMD